MSSNGRNSPADPSDIYKSYADKYNLRLKNDICFKDLYSAVSGCKLKIPEEGVFAILMKNFENLLEGIIYFKSTTNEPPSKPPSHEISDSKTIELVNKLIKLTGLPEYSAKEVITSYVLCGFRGSPVSFQEMINTEELSLQVLIDVFCFFYRERQFALKTLLYPICNRDDHEYKEIFDKFFHHINLSSLIRTFHFQLNMAAGMKEPITTDFTDSQRLRFMDLWYDYHALEFISLLKGLLLSAYYSPTHLDYALEHFIKIIKIVKKKHFAVLHKKKEYKHLEQTCARYATVIKLLVIHFMQLLNFDLDFENDVNVRYLKKLHKEILEIVHFGEETDVIAIIWSVYNLKINKKGQIYGSVLDINIDHIYKKASDPLMWNFFKDVLSLSEMEDKMISKIVHHEIHKFTTIVFENVELEDEAEDNLIGLGILLVRDKDVIDTLWRNEESMLLHIFKQLERWFPVDLNILEMYSNIALSSKENAEIVIERLNTKLLYSEVFSPHLELQISDETLSSYQKDTDYYPLEFETNIIIPAGVQCVFLDKEEEHIQWQICLPFFSIAHDWVKRWQHQMNIYPLHYELAKTKVLKFLKFINILLKQTDISDKKMLSVLEDVICTVVSFTDKKLEHDIVSTAMISTKELLYKFADDIIVGVYDGLKFVPTFDHIKMNYLELASKKNFHPNILKKFLELEEIPKATYPMLNNYLESIIILYDIYLKRRQEEDFDKDRANRKLAWIVIAGVVFTVHDILPQMGCFNFNNEHDIIKLHKLCYEIILIMFKNSSFDAMLREGKTIPIIETSVIPEYTDEVPTPDDMASVCLCTLLNTQAGDTILRFISIGEQRVFTTLEKYCWENSFTQDLIKTLEYGLMIIDQLLLYKPLQMAESMVSYFEGTIYREASSSNHMFVVLSVSSYIYCIFSDKIRYLALKVLSRFALNTDISLNACLGLSPSVLRSMFVVPLFSIVENQETKIANIGFIVQCVLCQSSLAEAFLNVPELKKYMAANKESGQILEAPKEGILSFTLNALHQSHKYTYKDKTYHASAKLLEVLWTQQRSVIISYLRKYNNFFNDLFFIIFNQDVFEGNLNAMYASVFNILAMELYYYLKGISNITADFQKKLNDFFQSDLLLKWISFAVDHKYKTEEVKADKVSIYGNDLTIALFKFLSIVMNTSYKISCYKDIVLCILDALFYESMTGENPLALESISQLFLLMIKNWKFIPMQCLETQMTKIISIISQFGHHYSTFWPNICSFFFTAIVIWLNRANKCNIFEQYPESYWSFIEVMQLLLNFETTWMCKNGENLTKYEETRMSSALCLSIAIVKVNTKCDLKIFQNKLLENNLLGQIYVATIESCKKLPYSEVSIFYLELIIEIVRKCPDILHLYITISELEFYLFDRIKVFGDSLTEVLLDHKNHKLQVTNFLVPFFIRGCQLAILFMKSKRENIRRIADDFFLFNYHTMVAILQRPQSNIQLYTTDLLRPVLFCIYTALVHNTKGGVKHQLILQNLFSNVKICGTYLLSLFEQPAKYYEELDKEFTYSYLFYYKVVHKRLKIQHSLFQCYMLCLNIMRLVAFPYSQMLSDYRLKVSNEEWRFALPIQEGELKDVFDRLDFYVDGLRYWVNILKLNEFSQENFKNIGILTICKHYDLIEALQVTLAATFNDFYTAAFYKHPKKEVPKLINDFLFKMNIFHEYFEIAKIKDKINYGDAAATDSDSPSSSSSGDDVLNGGDAAGDRQTSYHGLSSLLSSSSSGYAPSNDTNDSSEQNYVYIARFRLPIYKPEKHIRDKIKPVVIPEVICRTPLEGDAAEEKKEINENVLTWWNERAKHPKRKKRYKHSVYEDEYLGLHNQKGEAQQPLKERKFDSQIFGTDVDFMEQLPNEVSRFSRTSSGINSSIDLNVGLQFLTLLDSFIDDLYPSIVKPVNLVEDQPFVLSSCSESSSGSESQVGSPRRTVAEELPELPCLQDLQDFDLEDLDLTETFYDRVHYDYDDSEAENDASDDSDSSTNIKHCELIDTNTSLSTFGFD
uniref:Uncharacterized protein n=1 Tax=Clastoptera arizonana TaxID=38151 RepID=A0A1B6CGD8_9HEMI